MSAMRVCVLGAQNSFWRSNKFCFLVVWPRSWHFWKEPKINSRCDWRCLLSWQVLFPHREMRISWQFCNNSEIHLWLWKVWSLGVCLQSSFYVTRARKNDKNRQNTLFCWKRWTWYPTNNCYSISHFNQPIIEKNNERIVCGHQSIRDYWRCVLSHM